MPGADASPLGESAVFTFEATHHAMAAEDALREAGIALEVVPPPRELSAGCGLALRVSLEDVPAAVEVLQAKDARWAGVYQLGPGQEVVQKLGW